MTAKKRKTVRVDDADGLVEALSEVAPERLLDAAGTHEFEEEANYRGYVVAKMGDTGFLSRDRVDELSEILEDFHDDNHQPGSLQTCREEPCRSLVAAEFEFRTHLQGHSWAVGYFTENTPKSTRGALAG